MQKWLQLLTATATILLLLILVACAVHLAEGIHHTILLFSLGVLLAYTLDPAVEWLRKTRLTKSGRVPSRELSVFVVVGAIVLVFGLLAWSLESHLVRQIAAIQQHKAEYQGKLVDLAAMGDKRLAGMGVHFSLSDTLKNPPPDMKAAGAKFAGEMLPFVAHFLQMLGESVIVLLIAIYFLIYSVEMKEKFNNLAPKELRVRLEIWETDVNRILGGFVRGQMLIALMIGFLAAIGCLAIGIKLWLVVGLIAVAAALIPVFGPYLGAIPALLAAAISPTHLHNPVVAMVVVLIYFVIINEIGSKVLYPKLVGSALGLHAVLVLFVLFAGLEIGGVVGVLFAAPLTALVIITVVHLYRLWQDLPDDLLADEALRSIRRKKGD